VQLIKHNKLLIIISVLVGVFIAVTLNHSNPGVIKPLADWPFLRNESLNQQEIGPFSQNACAIPAVIITRSYGFPFGIYDFINCKDSINVFGILANYILIISATLGITLLSKYIFQKIKNRNA
jgi:hypothetical protein